MSNKSYFEKLKDPRWQKKRLEVLNYYDFTCQKCSDSESTLHVHHKEYFKNAEPWEYEKEQLTVLCDSCHETTHLHKDLLKYVSSFLDTDGPNDRNSIAFIIAGYIGMDKDNLLKDSDYEPCAYVEAFYDLGIRCKNLKFNFHKFIEKQIRKTEASNG